MEWRALGEEIGVAIAGAEVSVLIVAPFIKRGTLEQLLRGLRPKVALEVYTRWNAVEVAAGVSDPDALLSVEGRGGTMRLIDTLHAKMFLVDGSDAFIGSANVTAAAMGTSRRPNLELVTRCRPSVLSLALFRAELRGRSRPATRIEMEQVVALARQLPKSTEDGDVTAAVDASAPLKVEWLPRFRSPERLFQIYEDANSTHDAFIVEAALQDLLRIAPRAGMAKAAFHAWTRDALIANPLIQSLDGHLSEPRRFGALCSWLKARTSLADDDRQGLQSQAQTLMRWLSFFAADRYAVSTPNRSEILHLRRDPSNRVPT